MYQRSDVGESDRRAREGREGRKKNEMTLGKKLDCDGMTDGVGRRSHGRNHNIPESMLATRDWMMGIYGSTFLSKM